MDFKDSLLQLSERIDKLKDNILTEEATKNAFIMPFINAMGYEVFNPLEVIPEFTCDIGIKKGEKIDYAILKDDQPIILIECKHWKENLNSHNGQLFRYFHVSKAKFGILTNGIEYRFYTDLEESNKMDEKPFLNIVLNDLKENEIEELKKFHKSYFNIENILNTANELKYMVQMKELISKEMDSPSPEFVKYFTKQIYTGAVKEKILEQFTQLLKKSFTQLSNDLITSRLKTALKSESGKEPEELKPLTTEPISEINTTKDEIDAFLIIKAIAAKIIDPSRIVMRDAKTYCAILLDDNNRKTICRLYFLTKWSIAFVDQEKKENKTEIKSTNEIYQLSDLIIQTIEALNK